MMAKPANIATVWKSGLLLESVFVEFCWGEAYSWSSKFVDAGLPSGDSLVPLTASPPVLRMSKWLS